MTRAASSLEGNFSRFLDNPHKHYRWVQQQQGRVLLDSDWNAQMTLLSHLLDTETMDLIGPSGGPVGHAGFKIEIGSALSFDGSGGVVALGTDPSLDFDGRSAFTLEVVIGPGCHGTVVSRLLDAGPDATSTGGYQLRIDGHGRPCWRRCYLKQDVENGDRVVYFRELKASSTLAVDRPSHVAIVHDGRCCRLYVDSIEVAADVGVDEGRRGDAELLFGAGGSAAQPEDPLTGDLILVRLWNVALTAEELGGRPNANAFGLLADWTLDDLSGPTVSDRVGDHDGILMALGEPASPAWQLSDFKVSPGRYYVEGVLCEKSPADDGNLSDRLVERVHSFGDPGEFRVFLDVWELYVTAIQDPQLREIALGGPSTTTRTQVLAQVDIQPWSENFPPTRTEGLLNARRLPEQGTLENRFYRVEIQRTGPAEAKDLQGKIWQGHLLSTFEARLDDVGDLPPVSGDLVTVLSSDEQGSSDRIAEVLEFDAPSRRCVLDLNLYHEFGAEPGLRIELRPKSRAASFKWSRQNGSVTLAIHPLEPTSKQVTVVDPDQLGLLAVGEWIEILDDLALRRERRPRLVQIAAIDVDTFTLTLVQQPPAGIGTKSSLHPFLRRWDQQDNADTQLVGGAVPIDPQTWMSMELGIQVEFEEAFYQGGDYWFFAARQETGDIEWPRDAELRPVPQPAMGIRHRYATLAKLVLTPGGPEIEDLRVLFQPLTALSSVPQGTQGRQETQGWNDLGAAPEPEPATNGSIEAWNSEGPSHGEASRQQASEAELQQKLDQMADDWQRRLQEHTVNGSQAARQAARQAAQQAAGEAVREARSADAESLAEEIRQTVSELLSEAAEEPAEASTTQEPSPPWPPDGCILSPSSEPSAGFEATGWFVDAQSDLPPWSSNTIDLSLAGSPAGIALVAAVGDRLILAGEGGFWHWTPYDPPEHDAPLSTPRRQAGFAELDGHIYAVGGLDAKNQYLATVERFDPQSDESVVCGDLCEGRADLALVAWDGKLYAAGGEERTLLRHASPKVEVYDPASDSWSRLPDLPEGVVAPTAVVMGGVLHVLGGRGELKQNGHYLDHHWAFHPESQTWQTRRPIPRPRQHAAGVELDGCLYLIGGEDGTGWLDILEVYDPRLDTWLPGRSTVLLSRLAQPSATVIAGRLTVVGQTAGSSADDGPLLHVNRFTPPPRLWAYRRQSIGE